MITNDQQAKLLTAVQDASDRWQAAFNSGNATGCAAQYEETATMQAKPFGTFVGTEAIQNFWQKLIDDGFTDVEYVDPTIDIVDESSAVLSAKWKMNNAQGVIHRELWVLDSDGIAKLREDSFEAISE